MDAVVRRQGEGEHRKTGPNSTVVKATSADTDGEFFLPRQRSRPTSPVRRRTSTSRCTTCSSSSRVRRLDDERLHAGPGTFLYVPPGVVHTFSNQSDDAVRFLDFNTPGEWENDMRDLAEAGKAGQLRQEQIGRIGSNYDFTPV